MLSHELIYRKLDWKIHINQACDWKNENEDFIFQCHVIFWTGYYSIYSINCQLSLSVSLIVVPLQQAPTLIFIYLFIYLFIWIFCFA